MKRRKSELGATATEYALMATSIAIVIVLAVTALGIHLSTLFDGACAMFPGGTC